MSLTISNSEHMSGTPSHVRDEQLSFSVSTGLKRVLGRELITDDEVAIFELVKNSFDADAGSVYIHFGVDEITVADDGAGMSFADLKEKWLFVAYSSKRNSTRGGTSGSFRDNIAERHQYAGSKGVGRFSSDRLGQLLTLQTRTSKDSVVHRLQIDWSDFDNDDTNLFGNVNVHYSQATDFARAADIPAIEHGTIIQIRKLSRNWTREDILRLRSGLAKLINPFGDVVDGFGITLIAEHEKAADEAAIKKYDIQQHDNRPESPTVVNGRVGNFIFSTLKQKTTYIDVRVDTAADTIETCLIDRGELIYRIRERSEYEMLKQADFHCELYYLNRAAKSTFARRVGIPAVQFGSVFLFRNGFRVFPIGEEGDDWFGIDRRKQQGYARFLGTRDIIGRIDVAGSENMFQEASSRNQGLIITPAVEQLKQCFWDHCVKRLERYVVPVSWGTRDVDTETLSVVESDSGRARVAAAVAALIGSEDIEVVSYSRRLIDVLNERSEQFESSLSSLRVIATNTQDPQLAARVADAEQRFTDLKRAEAEARRIADEERVAKEQALSLAESAHIEAQDAREQLGEERKRSLFLTSISSLDVETVLALHHSITIHAAAIQIDIKNLILRIGSDDLVHRDTVINGLERIAFQNQKVLAIARFATKANFRVQSEFTVEDLADYVVQYIENVAKSFLGDNIDISVVSDGKTFECRFKPFDVSIVVDNLVHNARKARASHIVFDIKQPRKGLLTVRVTDDGRGIAPNALSENRLFEKGFTTTEGSGLGLYHVRQVLSDMSASIDVEQTSKQGTTFIMRFPL